MIVLAFQVGPDADVGPALFLGIGIVCGILVCMWVQARAERDRLNQIKSDAVKRLIDEQRRLK